MKKSGPLTFKTLIYDILDHGSIKVTVNATYQIEFEGYKYTTPDVSIVSVFADEHLNPNVNIANEIGATNLEQIKDESIQRAVDEVDGIDDLSVINDAYEEYE